MKRIKTPITQEHKEVLIMEEVHLDKRVISNEDCEKWTETTKMRKHLSNPLKRVKLLSTHTQVLTQNNFTCVNEYNIDDTVPYHQVVKHFLSKDECETICAVIDSYEEDLMKEDYIIESTHEGLTGKFMYYNLLNLLPNTLSIDLQQRVFDLELFKDLDEVWIQCWANKSPQGTGITKHFHGMVDHGKTTGQAFACSSFLQGHTESYTHFESDQGYIQVRNEVGHLHILDEYLMHEVKQNIHTTPRYSLAMDVHINNPKDLINYDKRIIHANRIH
jgi:hypothetical protein